MDYIVILLLMPVRLKLEILKENLNFKLKARLVNMHIQILFILHLDFLKLDQEKL